MLMVYQIVLLASALFASWSMGLVLRYAFRVLGVDRQHAQLSVVMAVLGFFMVTAMPAALVIGALVVVVEALVHPARRFSRVLGLLVGAALLALALVQSPGHWPGGAWAVGLYAAGGVLGFGLLQLVQKPTHALPQFGLVTAIACLPLFAAPLIIKQVHGSLALDAALLLVALLGGMAHKEPTSLPVRVTVALVMAYLAAQAAHYGAWPLGLVSALLFAGGVMTGRKHA